MPRNPNKRHCEHPGCRAWAMHDGTLCSAHGGRSQVRSRAEVVLPTLEDEVRWLVECREKVDGFIRERVTANDASPAEALRYLAVAAQYSRAVAALLARLEKGGSGELQRFLAAVSVRAREIAQPAEEEPEMND